jgi:hypothetical protein
MADVAQCLNGPVTAGDVVRIVLPTPCCGERADLGTEYQVVSLVRVIGRCWYCGAIRDGILCTERDGFGTPPALLVRVDPPVLVEGVEDVAKVPA